MEVATEIMKQVVQILMVPVKKHLGYMISCTKYTRDMAIKMAELNAARLGIEERTNQNTSNRLEVPTQVSGWLEEVGKINGKVESIPSAVDSCFDLKIRHKVGKKAVNIIEEIDSVMRRHSMITWTDHPIPLGRVDSMNASTTTSSNNYNNFQSREVTFTKALKALGVNQKSHMIALCGMGGVGKTTMMQRLKKVVHEKKMFNFIVEAVIGEKTDPVAIQDAIADYLGVELNEKSKQARADKLRQGFKDKSDGGKNKFFVILDDVWQSVDLEDIGLSPFPNQGVDFKVLLTSRDRHVCTVMGVEAKLILNVGLLIEAEAQSLFHQFVVTSEPELHKIGEDIVKKCFGLPIAIKTMACTLRHKRKDAWKDALSRLEHHDIQSVVPKVFETSYNNLKDKETKSVFLMCGLFPEDLDIPIEELMRYGWGLRLFDRVNTITQARNRLNTCIERLVHTNLLIESVDGVHVKMHDLVRAFVLGMFSEVEHASIVNHGNMPEWTENDMTDSCKQISLTCKSMLEFPGDLKFPNLKILKLMHGGKSLRYPQDFYQGMEKLEVISYDEMKYPLLPSLPQCSTILRVLHLHECSLRMFDCSSIGNLFNMEVLSFANSSIELLPSVIGNLKKLRLLDLTNCYGVRIEKDVLKNLVKLEELYIRNGSTRFTEDNYKEMAERSNNLSTLEVEFFNNKAQVKNMSFENLERFKISVGGFLDRDIGKSSLSYENTLHLVSNKGEVINSKLNQLFVKTELLFLSVDGMNDLEDVEVKSTHPPQSSSFCYLRVLFISECVELRYLFKLHVANTLSNLEHLKVYDCDNMEELVHNGTEGSGKDTITFPKLKFLSLCGLPKLLGLCLNVNIIELPELLELKLDSMPSFTSIYPKNKLETSSLLKEEVVIPKLERLQIDYMENIKEIWPCEHSRGAEVKLREIEVRNCDKLVNLFPYNPMSLLHHLEELEVNNCDSIESLFNIDLDSAGEIGEEKNSSNLRSIKVWNLGKLREVWSIKGKDNSRPLIGGFEAVESIEIVECEMFRNVFTPITTNFDLGALLNMDIRNCGENKGNDSEESREEEESIEEEESSEEEESIEEEEQSDILLEEETLQKVTDSIANVVFPSSLVHSFHNLHQLALKRYEGVEVVFEIKSPTSRELVTTHHKQHPILPNLKNLNLSDMDNMSHVWKCNRNFFFTLPKQQSESPFHNLTNIYVEDCKTIKYLFSPLMAELLSNLKEVKIEQCDGIEEVVSNRDDGDEEKTTFTSTSVHTSPILFPQLDSLTLKQLKNLKRIGGGGAKDESNEMSFNNTTTTTAFVNQHMFSEADSVSWRLSQYSREIIIKYCHALSNVIPCNAAGQMQKLQVLKIKNCNGMKEVFVSQEMNSNNKSGGEEGKGGTLGIPRLNKVIMLPNLKILKIVGCPFLKHIFTFSALESLGQLEELTIKDCVAMQVIVKKEEDVSSKEVVVFPRLKSIALEDLPKLQMLNIHSRNMKILELKYCESLEHIFTFSAHGSLRQLEELTISGCGSMKVILKEEEDQSSSSSSLKDVVDFPQLKSIEIQNLPELEGFFLGMNEFRLPSLDNVKIDNCPKMMVFAPGGSTTPELKYIVYTHKIRQTFS
ncbi:uncharacterized protein LOC111879926 [Lactuca sativa]|uniref:uncharacterized protein LOC111879926 n=1 Tax=Lactuca sativa TaxID=4236 RepID=UPI000CD8E63E|nr:uncharacterized protein LOC111879926 [Lactuca sativa]